MLQVKAGLKHLPRSGTGLSVEKVGHLLRLIHVYHAETEMYARDMEAASRELATTRDQYKTLFDFAPAGYIVLDPKGIVQNINLTACVMLGIDRNQATGSAFNEYLQEGGDETFTQYLHEVFETEMPIAGELKIKYPGGGGTGVAAMGMAINSGEDARGHLLLWDANAEKPSWERNPFFKKSLDTLLTPMYIYDLDNRLNVYVTPQYTGLTGYTSEQLNALGPRESLRLFHPDDLSGIIDLTRTLLRGGEDEIGEVTYRFKTAAGDWMWCHARAAVFERDPGGRARFIIGTVTDITRQKQSESELSELREFFRDVFDNTNDILFISDPKSDHIIHANKKLVGLTGYLPEELLQLSVFDLYPLEEAERVREKRRRMAVEGTMVIQTKLRCKDGSLIETEVMGKAITYGQRQVFLSILRDITERREMEEDMIQQHAELVRIGQRLTGFINSIGDCIAMYDAELRLVDCNQIMCTLVNAANKNELLGQHIGKHPAFIHEEDTLKKIEGVMRNGISIELVREIEHPTQGRRWYNILLFRAEEVLGVIGQDITGQRETETRVMKAALEAQEQERQRLAADLHDTINPLLSTAKLNMESLEGDIRPRKEKYRQRLQNAIELLTSAMKEVRNISADLMPGALRNFGLVEALDELCKKISQSEKLEVNFSHSLARRPDQKTELALYRITQELLNNVIKHARASKAEVTINSQKNQIVMTVSDDGIGIDQENRNPIGRGLGLQNISTRVKLLGGTLNIRHAVLGKGTIVVIKVPDRGHQ